VVLARVIGDVPAHLLEEVRSKQRRLLFVELEDDSRLANRDEAAQRVDEAQRIERLGAAITCFVAAYELGTGVQIIAEPQQIYPEIGARGPQLGIGRERLAIVRNAVVVAHGEDELMRDERIALAIRGIQGPDAREPALG